MQKAMSLERLMLCDEFLPGIDWLRREGAPDWAIADMKGFAGAMGLAQRFVFDEIAAETAGNIVSRRPSSIRDALHFARTPATLTWIEMAWAHSLPLRVGGPKGDKPNPKRIGYLITTDADCHAGQIVLAWQHPLGEAPVVCPLGYVFDFRPNPNLGDYSFAGSGYARADLDAATKHVEMEAIRDLHRRFGIVPALYREGFWTASGPHRSPEQIRGWGDDIAGEALLVTALLLVLQCRNIVQIDPQDPAQLNRQRKKSGKPPLYTYNKVVLRLEEKRAAAARKAGLSPQEIRRHFVRGHFKTRKTGVYFWAPYFRGNAQQGFADKEYVVRR